MVFIFCCSLNSHSSLSNWSSWCLCLAVGRCCNRGQFVFWNLTRDPFTLHFIRQLHWISAWLQGPHTLVPTQMTHRRHSQRNLARLIFCSLNFWVVLIQLAFKFDLLASMLFYALPFQRWFLPSSWFTRRRQGACRTWMEFQFYCSHCSSVVCLGAYEMSTLFHLL